MDKLPILMYHNVSLVDTASRGLTISTRRLEEQLSYLKQQGYHTYHFRELEDQVVIQRKSVVLTFDDVTVNQLIYAVPLLEKFQMKATFFIPFKYIGQVDQWNNGVEPLMSIEQLKSLPECIELGYHSFEHRHFTEMTAEEIQADFIASNQIITSEALDVYAVMAYPYGNFPKKDPQRSNFFGLLKQNQIKYGLRIGNKVNRFPFSDPYEIKRLDVKGQDSLRTFKFRLRFGKLF